MTRKTLAIRLTFLLGILSWVSTSQLLVAQNIPPFKMQLTNGKIFTAEDLSKQKPSIIIYFAPDCEHCQALIHSLLSRANDFKNSQIVLVSFEPLKMVSNFESAYHLDDYKNIKCGTEIPTFYFKNLFALDKTPFTALYSEKGKLIVSYRDVTPIADLVDHLKNYKKI